MTISNPRPRSRLGTSSHPRSRRGRARRSQWAGGFAPLCLECGPDGWCAARGCSGSSTGVVDHVPAEAMEVDALAQDGAADQDFGEHGTAVREHESFAGLALGVPVDHARPETRGRPAVLRGKAFARPAFGAYLRSLGTSHLSLRQTPKVRTSVTCCVHLLDRPANPLPNGAACVIERDAGTPEHGRKGIESGSGGGLAAGRRDLLR